MRLAVQTEHHLHARLPSSIGRAVRFVVDMQAKSGIWADFDLEAGVSDAWTTAYVGACLLAAEPCVPARERPYVRTAVEQAGRVLHTLRRSDGTWGYNANVPSDSDSTSWAALFLTASGSILGEETYRALRTFARGDGGFATFNGAEGGDRIVSAWQCSHPDVTPVVAYALATSSAVHEKTLEYILAQRRVDGLWNSYWYRTPLYATLHNLIALSRAGRTVRPPATAIVAALAATRDPFELAIALEIVTRFGAGQARGFAFDAVASLVETQSAEGWWIAEPMLRVTDPSIERPWDLPGDAGGPLYSDEYFTFTTATVVRALSFLLRGDGRAAREDVDGYVL